MHNLMQQSICTALSLLRFAGGVRTIKGELAICDTRRRDSSVFCLLSSPSDSTLVLFKCRRRIVRFLVDLNMGVQKSLDSQQNMWSNGVVRRSNVPCAYTEHNYNTEHHPVEFWSSKRQHHFVLVSCFNLKKTDACWFSLQRRQIISRRGGIITSSSQIQTFVVNKSHQFRAIFTLL